MMGDPAQGPAEPGAQKKASLDIQALARALGPAIRGQRAEIERGRQLPASLVAAMRAAQMFQLWLPAALGGPEVHPRELIAAVKELARADGSAGWCAGIASVCGLFAPGLPEVVAREVYGNGHIVAGTLNPAGKAVAVPGGYRVNGRWSYGSAVDCADWMIAGCVVHDGDIPRLTPAGTQDIRLLFVPRDAVEVIDTWKVSGLRGTGSHDTRLVDLFVPEERSVVAFRPSGGASPLYRMPIISLFATVLASVALGIARAGIDALTELAGAKIPMGSQSLLRDKVSCQINVGRAEAMVRAAEAFLLEAVQSQWDEAVAGMPPTLEKRAILRAATTFASEASARAMDLVHEAAGGSAIHETSPIERCFRDVHAATQHIGLSIGTYELVGRVFLGLEPGTPRF
jgi:indole-3-acetate monooxygenase